MSDYCLNKHFRYSYLTVHITSGSQYRKSANVQQRLFQMRLKCSTIVWINIFDILCSVHINNVREPISKICKCPAKVVSPETHLMFARWNPQKYPYLLQLLAALLAYSTQSLPFRRLWALPALQAKGLLTKVLFGPSRLHKYWHF